MYNLQNIATIDFVGNITSRKFNKEWKNKFEDKNRVLKTNEEEDEEGESDEENETEEEADYEDDLNELCEKLD